MTPEEFAKVRDVSYQGYKIVILSGPPNAEVDAVFFRGGKEVFFEPFWQSRPDYILGSAIWLKQITGKKSFNSAFKKAKEYKFKEM